MLAIAGTVPDEDLPLITGPARLEDNMLQVAGHRFPVNRGTPALIAAAVKAGPLVNGPPVFAYLAGDTGLGRGSRALYKFLTEFLPGTDFKALTFHYLQPDVDWHNRVLFAVEAMKNRPVLIADAGFMYAAKMSGLAGSYDLFTPDIGELAFLADEEAPHPFYTRGFILHEDNKAPDLIARAYEHDNAARYLVVKGRRDYIASNQGILDTVDSPVDEPMEAIGGTGDTLTGILSSLIASGMSIEQAAPLAARANRLAGHMANPTPATQIIEIIEHIPAALNSLR